jgi:hypothetical protein
MQPLYKQEGGLFGYGEGKNKFGDVAHIPQTGPAGELCRGCQFIRHNKNATQWGKCAKAAELRRVPLSEISLIPLTTESCKYFKLRGKDDPKPWDRIVRVVDETVEPEMFK